MGSNPIADISGWSHRGRRRKLALSPGVALRSTQARVVSAPSLTCVGGTRKGRKRKERVVCLSVTPFLKAFFFAAQHSKLSPISQSDQQWLLAGSSQFAHCTQVRMGSNPIADMSGWSHRGRRRKLAPSPGVALRSTQVRVVSAPSLTCVGGTRKGRKRKERVVCLSVTPFLKAFFFAAQHSKLHRSPSLTSNGYLPAAVSLPEWLRG